MAIHWRRALYGSTIFAGALLLFLVQPMMARTILPWFGGSAGVWTMSMLFFQVLLLAGYWYAHQVVRLPARGQAVLHAALLAVSLALLPVIPASRWKPADPSAPGTDILLLLAATVGLPYFLLSTTSPLLQSWYARESGGSPYRLYAVSNFASLAALLAYPVVIEPALRLRTQLAIWSAAYAGFALLCGASALAALGRKQPALKRHRAPWRSCLLWMTLAACPSALWLGTANQVSQSVAPIPFIWILPLSLYLLTLVLCFEREGWYRRGAFRLLAPAGVLAMSVGVARQWNMPLQWTVLLLLAGLFLLSMFCHGELARRKPEPEQLTSFYLMVALGGALGGFFVAVAAPRLLNAYLELQIALVLCVLLQIRLLYGFVRTALLVRLSVVAVMALWLALWLRGTLSEASLSARNFYGAVQVAEGKGPDALRVLYHGSIIHGSQFVAPERTRTATTYYGPASGVALALDHGGDEPRRVGLIGLGPGTLAAYGRPGDIFRFYEINPLVVEIARRHFRYLAECPARTELVLGDGRLALERESPQNFDVLVVDAFSGDSIPVHLLTREAFELYFRHLKPEGTLAVHLTNRYIDLAPVVNALAGTFGKTSHVVHSLGDGSTTFSAIWAMITGDAVLEETIAAAALPTRPTRRAPVWTDDYSNPFRLLR